MGQLEPFFLQRDAEQDYRVEAFLRQESDQGVEAIDGPAMLDQLVTPVGG